MAGAISAYQQLSGDAMFYPSATYDPPAPSNPWIPATNAGAMGLGSGTTNGGASSGPVQVSLIGLLVVGALLILMHHLHLRASAGGSV